MSELQEQYYHALLAISYGVASDLGTASIKVAWAGFKQKLADMFGESSEIVTGLSQLANNPDDQIVKQSIAELLSNSNYIQGLENLQDEINHLKSLIPLSAQLQVNQKSTGEHAININMGTNGLLNINQYQQPLKKNE